MTTFAHTETGQALDPATANDSAEYAARFNAEAMIGWEIAQVPDGTRHGARSNGDGTYTSPATVSVARPLILSKTAFQDYAVLQLGGGEAGMARFTEIMDATSASASGAVRFAYARYEAASTFEKTNTATLTAIMAGDTQTGHLTADERTAILDNWPAAG